MQGCLWDCWGAGKRSGPEASQSQLNCCCEEGGVERGYRRVLRPAAKAGYLITRLLAESGTVFRSSCGDDASPRYHGNGDAGNRLGNPDIRVLERTEKEDGLYARGAEEEKNADGDKKKGGEETKDLRKNGNSKDTLETNGQPRAGRRAEGRKLRHVPGGTWLSKKTEEYNYRNNEHYLAKLKEHSGTEI
ncbi:hypothetical protein NDU88_009923 [Pleurodeles waltl]|uniref:Uncharacterized protein n=1 Tax=Pleurodeles waltl TaxID=8319 RepID=A0AAV7RZ39_PLEWA|nr:hypothetical protein NDU88_009923 [Pleurodeles waltl]